MPKEHRLTEALRAKLAKPAGRLYAAEDVWGGEFSAVVKDARLVISVGDRVTETFGLGGRVPDVQVVDSLENRKERRPPKVAHSRLLAVENPAGTITDEAVEGIKEAFRGDMPVRVSVNGEEDLLAIPAIALAPEGAVVFYGQPGEGVVAVKVDAASKARNRELLARIGLPETA